jgi:membrane protease YdiL (CAAX protease family)
MESSVIRKQHLWVYAILPVLVLNVGGLLIYGVYYALASVQPRLVAHIPSGQLTFAVYLLTAAVVWPLAYSIIRTARRYKTPLITLVAPQGLRALKWGPAIGIFLLMNLIFAAYVLFVRLLGTWPTFPGLELWQEVSILLVFVVIEPFCEELIWRGYLIPRLLERGQKPWGAVLLAAVSFALIHGIFLPDKLVAVFLIGLTNGWYYLRQRNLVPLIIAHAVLNLWSFSLFFFLRSLS